MLLLVRASTCRCSLSTLRTSARCPSTIWWNVEVTARLLPPKSGQVVPESLLPSWR
ncbi:hypothetical protein DPMN_073678 [Dreissena polymorpha]|uniref:Uncharacterized protein n=1 Tax=Dreissena polymorpha TaxID=45954 RepID=A0A9D4HDM9_DREPO|nr:hypothetical protein DPMN_073673 [Dreissena polymorpha]KAH3713877.1 hypothetical protein DPMN_073678 [Dreissena polymorpha]